MIYESNGTYTISSRHMWLPGIYDSEKTARWAFQFSNETLQALSDRICRADGENRAITAADLRAARTASREHGEAGIREDGEHA